MRGSASTRCAWLLGATIFVPPLVFYEGSASSLALGTSLISTVLIGVALFSRGLGHRWGAMAPFVAALLAFIVLHALCIATILPVDFVRTLASCVLLVLLLLAGLALARLVARCVPAKLDLAIFICLALMVTFAVFASLGFAVPSSASYDKPTFPFSEPSQFALSFAPLLMYACVVSRSGRRLLLLAVGLAVAVALQNLTLVMAWSLVAALCLRRWIFLGVAVGIAALASQMDLAYYSQRIDFSSEALNLSNLVYLQGWELVGESWLKSWGWGVGFQQLGLDGSDTGASELIYTLIGNASNLTDGGFNFSKIVGEFGVFGLALVAAYLRKATAAWRTLRRMMQGSGDPARGVVFAHCVVLSYSLELFVRGEGYFTGTAILLVTGLVLTKKTQPSLASTTSRSITGLLARP